MTALPYLAYPRGAGETQRLLDRLTRDPDRGCPALTRLLGEAACRQLAIYPIPDGFKLSVVIPVYNERQWVRRAVRRVEAVPLPKEIILVDDCSTDGTRDILKEFEAEGHKVVYQPKNQGKVLLRTGFEHASGTVIVVQDADLEYDPAEISSSFN